MATPVTAWSNQVQSHTFHAHSGITAPPHAKYTTQHYPSINVSNLSDEYL